MAQREKGHKEKEKLENRRKDAINADLTSEKMG